MKIGYIVNTIVIEFHVIAISDLFESNKSNVIQIIIFILYKIMNNLNLNLNQI